MATRHEVTTKYARDYALSGKKDKGWLLDELVGVTGWPRANARRAAAAAASLGLAADRQPVQSRRFPRVAEQCRPRPRGITGAYAPSKTFLNAVTIQYAKELAGTNI